MANRERPTERYTQTNVQKIFHTGVAQWCINYSDSTIHGNHLYDLFSCTPLGSFLTHPIGNAGFSLYLLFVVLLMSVHSHYSLQDNSPTLRNMSTIERPFTSFG